MELTPGQTRIFVLLIVLFLLEVYRVPAIKNFAQGAVSQWKTALNNASKGG